MTCHESVRFLPDLFPLNFLKFSLEVIDIQRIMSKWDVFPLYYRCKSVTRLL